jgi:hypothetical protein
LQPYKVPMMENRKGMKKLSANKANTADLKTATRFSAG